MVSNLRDAAGLLTVMAMRGVGAVTVERIVERFSTLDELRDATPERCKGVLNVSLAAAFRDPVLLDEARGKAARILELASRRGVSVVTAYEPGYPERLAVVPERPVVVYVRGHLDALSTPCVAVAGLTEPTRFGEAVTRKVVSRLVEVGWGVAGGLGTGVEAVVRDVVKDGLAPPVLVAAGGFDSLGVRQSAVVDAAVEAGGAVISEKPFGHQPDTGSTIRALRVRTGLSYGVVVTQSHPDGVPMQAARYALCQGLPVFAPLAPAPFDAEPANVGTALLVTGTGSGFVRAIGAKGTFVDLVAGRWADVPVGRAIRGTHDYPAMIATLAGESYDEPASVDMR